MKVMAGVFALAALGVIAPAARTPVPAPPVELTAAEERDVGAAAGRPVGDPDRALLLSGEQEER